MVDRKLNFRIKTHPNLDRSCTFDRRIVCSLEIFITQFSGSSCDIACIMARICALFLYRILFLLCSYTFFLSFTPSPPPERKKKHTFFCSAAVLFAGGFRAPKYTSPITTTPNLFQGPSCTGRSAVPVVGRKQHRCLQFVTKQPALPQPAFLGWLDLMTLIYTLDSLQLDYYNMCCMQRSLEDQTQKVG